ncbi:MAG: DUF4332 domain-containing protein [Anaerolineae bacterium]
MPLAISKLKGVTADLQAKFKATGVKTAEDLFNKAVTPAGRQLLAEHLGVAHEVILELANRADLSRIKGIAGVYSDMLEEAGVDTVKELAQRNAENLHAKLLEVNAAKNLVKRPPTLSAVKEWITAAKRRRKFLQY